MKNKCNHHFIRQDTGSVFLSYGEYDDDIREDWVCLKCGRYLSEIETEDQCKQTEQPNDRVTEF